MDTKQPKKKLKIKIRKSPKATGTSLELLDMLRKLASWNPRSDEAVLEAANRLAQAAREKITPDLFKKPDTSVADAFDRSKTFIGHTLTRFNGISDDHYYIFDIAITLDRTIMLRTVHMFRYNRIGELSVSIRELNFSPCMIMADRSKVISVKEHADKGPLPGYTLDTPDAAATLKEARTLIDGIGMVLPKPSKRRKK
ncbi:MAG: hypothetical protein IKA48_00780 [Fibrobacter sp.]|nr:hypothetical protein [Fibrobacter sp.]